MNEKEIILRQYEKFIDSAEKVSDRRQISNNFFLSLNSVLLSFTGFLTTYVFEFWHAILAFAGMCISILWFLTITSFRNLNSGKFKVIHNIEKKLPIKLFDDEWTYLGRGSNLSKYVKISLVEQGIPIIFLFLYILVTGLMLV